MNGGDDRNHGSAEVISKALRDDESEDNDAEMLDNDADMLDNAEETTTVDASASNNGIDNIDNDFKADDENVDGNENLESESGERSDIGVEKNDTPDEMNQHERK